MTRLLVNGQHVLYCPALASKIGRSAATILQQANYWMSVKGGKTIDGIKWFWKTYQQWAEELSLSVSTVRRAIAHLKTLGFIAVERLSAKTYYQANWYTVNKVAVKDFVNEHIDISITEVSTCSQSTDDIKEFTSKEFASQQHAAVELKNLDEPELREQAPVTHFVDEPELDYSTNEPDCLEGHFSAAGDVVEKANDAIVSKSAPVSQYVEEVELDLTDSDAGGENSGKPSKKEIAEVCTELRRLRINPQVCLGVVKKHWGNVTGAIARVKDAIAEGWCENPTGLFINSCKSGAKGKNAVTSDVSAWFRWAYNKRIVGAMSGGVAYTPDGEPVDLQQMMRLYPCPHRDCSRVNRCDRS